MALTEHLSELRKRILYSLVVLLAVFVVLFNYSEVLFAWLTLPMKSELSFSLHAPFVQLAEKKATSLVFLAPAEAFWMHLKVSMVAALVVSLPVVFYHIWKF